MQQHMHSVPAELVKENNKFKKEQRGQFEFVGLPQEITAFIR